MINKNLSLFKVKFKGTDQEFVVLAEDAESAINTAKSDVEPHIKKKGLEQVKPIWWPIDFIESHD